METVKQHVASYNASIKTNQSSAVNTWFNKLVVNFENARFWWMTMIITFQSCLGSIACGYILQSTSDIVMLSVCAVLTMSCNALLIAQAPAKWCVRISLLSIIVNAAMIVASLMA